MKNSSDKGYKWKIGAKVRFRLKKVFWQNMEATKMHQIIFLKANEPGLGPFDWWLWIFK